MDTLERLIHEYEPYLRQMARRHLSPQLRPHLDSVDLVQSVWAQVLRANAGQEGDGDRLRGLLGRILRHRLIDHARRIKASRKRAECVAPEQAGRSPSRPSELAQANELWHRIQTLCPVQHRPILELKQQGLSLDEIAVQTGLHPSSVRRILYELARQVALDPNRPARRG